MRITNTTMKILAILLGGLFITAIGSAGSVTFTGAEQQVGLGIGYKADDADHPLIEQLYPVPPQGLGDAELNISRVYADYSVSASASLTSSFEPNKVTVNGLATASNTWLNPPSGTLDIHAGSGAIFHLYLSTGSSPANLHITGGVSFRDLLGMFGSIMWHPEDNYAYVRLSVAGGPIIWETRVNGSDIQASKLIEQDLQLAAGQNYVLEAFAMTGTCNKWHSKGVYSPEASFHFTATAHAPVSPGGGSGGSSPCDTNDLAGSWYIHSLASGPGAPWWEYGHVTVGADHSFSGVVQEYKKDPCEVSGRFLLAPNGVATFVGAAHDPDVVVFPHLHMAANKSMIAGVATWSAGFPGTTQMIVMMRRGASYQIADLVGTWYVHSLASGPGAPWWEHGSLAVSADGSFTATVQPYKSEPGTISGQFQIDPNGVVTIESVPDFTIGHMSSDKNMIAMVDTWATGSPGTTELRILTRKGENYSISDLSGKWYVSSLASGAGAPWWQYGPIAIGPDGSFRGSCQQYNYKVGEISGQFQIDADGVVTMKGKTQNPYLNGYSTLHLSADKNVIVGVSTWSTGSPGTSEMLVFTRITAAN